MPKYIAVLIFIFYVFPFFAHSETGTVNSGRKLTQMPDDTSKLQEIIAKIRHYEDHENQDSSDVWLKKGLYISSVTNNIKYQAYFFEKLAAIHLNYIENSTEGPGFLYNAIYYYKQLPGEEKNLSLTNLSLGLAQIYLSINERKMALAYVDSAKQYFNKCPQHLATKDALVEFINFYIRLHDYKSALIYSENYFRAQKLPDTLLNIVVYRLQEDCYKNIGEYQKALAINDKVLELTKNLPNKSGRYMYDYHQRGKIYKKSSKVDQALDIFKKGLVLAKNVKHLKWQVIFAYEISSIYYEKHQLAEAKQLCMQLLQISLREHYQTDVCKGYKLLGSIYYDQKDFKNALKYLDLYHTIRDSANPKLRNVYLASIGINRELLKIRLNNQKLKEESDSKELLLHNEVQKNYILLLFASLLAVFGFIIFIIYQGNARQRKILAEKNTLIEQQYNEITEINEEILAKNDHLTKIIQEKSDLIGIVSHDLKAPLNRAFGLTQLIQLEAEKFSNIQKDLLQKLSKELMDERNLITEILNAELLEAELNEISLEYFDPIGIILESVESFKAIADEKKINIVVEKSVSRKDIRANKLYLKRIVDNLLSNAIKFSTEKKSVFVKVKTLGSKVRIDIQDQGPGFTEEDKKNLFKKYHKLSAKATAGESSTGLGLSIVKRLVEVMHGNITLKSSHGAGAMFIIEFEQA